MFDPMLNPEFRKYEKNDREERRNQYNQLVAELPIWNVLDKQKLKYYDYKSSQSQNQNTQPMIKTE